MALFALCAFQAFLFVTTLYLQEVRGLSAFQAGLCLVPVGAFVIALSPISGRLVGSRGSRPSLLIASAALCVAGGASSWLSPRTPILVVLVLYAVVGVFLGMVNPPITNTAISGMPLTMAGLAASLASAGRQTGSTLGVAIAGAIVGPALVRGDAAYTESSHDVSAVILVLGLGLALLALLSTGSWARSTAHRAAALFE